MAWHRNVERWEHMASFAAGAVLVGLALRKRGALGAAGSAGLGLIALGTLGVARGKGRRRRDDTRTALGGSNGIRVRESITIAAPRSVLYDFWREPENLPRIMHHIERVDNLGDGRTRWVMKGPAGTRVEWDAETINAIEPELIAWRSLPGADVASAGSVRFRRMRNGYTRVMVTMQYDPPFGKAGAALAAMLGSSPSLYLREDLRRLKVIFEAAMAGPEVIAETQHSLSDFSLVSERMM